MKSSARGRIFKIAHYAIHDGPGIRTTVFMKGCPARCLWCCSPESQSFEAQIVWKEGLCSRCGRCVRQCPNGALSLDGRSVIVEARRCTICGECSSVCPGNAIGICGQDVTPLELLETASRDLPFWRRSGGGVTVSGGEALAQPLFLREFLELCRSRSIHTAIETCLCADRSAVAMISELADFIQFDIKAMSPVLHRRLTSVDNGRILQNASFLLKQNLAPLVRFPLVPGCNDDEGELNALGEFLAENGPGSALEILPYHRLGVGMYGALGREYALPDTPVPSKAEIDRAAAILGRYPINIISQTEYRRCGQ